ncbi:MAG: polymer-forming cytoskeletal protein [Actinobacteria bacterium]|nr:polymer-forming cytoskeletal protein [Actinomycetota bacterium]
MANIYSNENYPNSDKKRTLLTITGDSAVLDGKFKISQSIEIDCELKGKLTVDGKLTIQANGFVSADVKTTEVEIIGKYEGNMEATGNVEIKETGIAVGNIKTDSLIINKGGIFSGNVTRISEEPVVVKKKGKSDTTIVNAGDGEEFLEKEEYGSINYDDNEIKISSDNPRFNNDENLSL